MSKAFTREEADEGPVLVAPRAPLPRGSANYVTPRGLRALQAELDELRARRSGLDATTPDADYPRAAASLGARIQELDERIASAVVVHAETGAAPAARLGARVVVRNAAGERSYEIVGVDEADAAAGRVAFVAPLARALLGKRAGDVVVFRTPRGREELEIVSIDYGEGE